MKNASTGKQLTVEELYREELPHALNAHIQTFEAHVQAFSKNHSEVKITRKRYKNAADCIEIRHRDKFVHEWLEDGENYDQLNIELGKQSNDTLFLSGSEGMAPLRPYYTLLVCILHDADPAYISGFDWLLARCFD